MILTCPSCSTRYQADAAKFPAAGRQVRCAKCGNTWHQNPPDPEPVAEAVVEAPVEAVMPPPDPPPADDLRENQQPSQPSSIRAFAPAATVAEKPPGQLGQTLAVVAGWIGLIAVVLAIGYSAVRYRQDIAAIWPQSAAVYSGVGLKVNAGGIDFRNVAYKRESEDGQPVLVVTGQIVNLASRELPIPQAVRVTLTDADNRELYHWPFKPSVPTLKAGGTLPFRTRLTNPPAAARFAVVTFAKD